MSETTNKPSIIFKGILGKPAKDTAKQVIEAIDEGKVDPLYAGVMLKKFSKIHEEVNKNSRAKGFIQDAVERAIEDSKSKTAEAYGAKITLATRGFWDYEDTDDPYLEALENIYNRVGELIKARKKEVEAKANAWTKENDPMSVKTFGIRPFVLHWDRIPYLEFEEESGEVSTNPPVKKGSDHLRYTL